MPDYVSSFAKKRTRKEPVATIRMTTRTTCHYESTLLEEGMRSRVDPAKYLGSNVSLTDSINSTLRLGTPHTVTSDALLQALVEPHNVANDTAAGKHRMLGTLRPTERSVTAPSGARRGTLGSLTRPNSTQSTLLQSTFMSQRSLSSLKARYGFEINGEVDADATYVDVDGILDQGSDLMLKDLMSPHGPSPTATTPPLPSAEVLSKRQLKLIGTTPVASYHDSGSVLSHPAVDKAIFNILNSPDISPSPGITPSLLVEMAGPVGERMMVNRAKLLLLQHSTPPLMDKIPMKPPTAPAGISRPSPVLESLNSADTSRTAMTDRATTAPVAVVRPTVTVRHKLRSTGRSQYNSVPSRSDSRAREGELTEAFTVQAVHPPRKRNYPVPPPSTSTCSTIEGVWCSRTPALETVWLQRTPHSERCANYKDPIQDNHGYIALDEDSRTLSETPLLQVTQDPFSSLSSFLPSTNSLVI